MRIRVYNDKAIVRFNDAQERHLFLRSVWSWDKEFKKFLRTFKLTVQKGDIWEVEKEKKFL